MKTHVAKISLISYDRNGEKHLNPNMTTKNRTSIFIFADIKIQLSYILKYYSTYNNISSNR